MKVGFQNGLVALSGASGDIVYCYNRRLGTVYTRRRVYPKLNENNEKLGSIAKNLFSLNPSAKYRSDFSYYMMQYKTLRRSKQSFITWSNLYIKLFYDMAKQDPSIDLRTLTREEIYARRLPCICIKDAVKAGLLPAVRDYDQYDHEF